MCQKVIPKCTLKKSETFNFFCNFYLSVTLCVWIYIFLRMNIFNCLARSTYISSVILKMNNLVEIRTFVFLDTETTGLPLMENNRTKITELCMVAVQAQHIRLGVFPRVQNKLSLCFNPWKYICADSEKITGLSNDLLEQQSKFSADTVNTINCFLNHNPKPICFVAHSGDNFDYPILRREIAKAESSLSSDIYCIDSLTAFRQLFCEEPKPELVKPGVNNATPIPLEFTDEYDAVLNEIAEESESGLSQKLLDVQKLNETTPTKQIVEGSSSYNLIKKIRIMPVRRNLNFGISFKLSDVYTRLTKKLPVNHHQAEGDVIMLITCAATLGDKFVDWANANTKKFCDIPEMVPGKKIGS